MNIRGRKSKITIDEESLEKILDECYHETNDLKTEINNIYSIWNTKVVEIGEIAAVGKDIVKLLDQRDKVIDKKLKVAQQIHNIISDRNKLIKAQTGNEENEGTAVLPNEIDLKINEMIEAARKGKN
jgi:hypothetical protein